MSIGEKFHTQQRTWLYNVKFYIKNAVLQCESKKQNTLLKSITSRNIDRFSIFFHWETRNKIFYKISTV